ncbi:MAG TPA: mechanosensitive ion channel family protein [Acidobacteriota bacterium]|nr:mechanosensitive ion channel family protein [Acidobacteriota bacterium]
MNPAAPVPPAPAFDLVRILLMGGILAAAVLIGLLLQRLFTSKLRDLAKKTSVAWDDLIVDAMKGFVVLWLILAGLAIGLKLVPLEPEALKIAQHGLGVLVILSAMLFFTRLARKAIYVYVDRIVEVPTSIFKNFATIVIDVIGFLIALDYLGVRIAPLLTALGVGGLAVALALQDTMSNLFAGLNILMTRKIRPGDFIRLDSGEEGLVCDITWRNTTLRAPDDNMIVVPNSKLGAAIVTNTHLPGREMGLFVPVTVAFDNDLALVERVTLEVAREAMAVPDRTVAGFEPVVRFGAFTELGVKVTVVLRLKEYQDQFPLRHDLLKRLHERYRAEGIKLAALPAGVMPVNLPTPRG